MVEVFYREVLTLFLVWAVWWFVSALGSVKGTERSYSVSLHEGH